MTTANHQTNECSLSDCFCHEAQRLESALGIAIPAPDFEQEWNDAPRWATRLTEQEIAEYWFIRGQHAKEVELLVQENEDLRGLIRVIRERMGR